MKLKNPSNEALIALGYLGFVFAVVTVIIIMGLVTKEVTQIPIGKIGSDSTTTEISALPIRIGIPTIDVSADIEYVGLTKAGDMDAPKNPDRVAWYAPGKRPGEIGNAVIAGHYGTWENGKGSVFDNLNKLVPGDKVIVREKSGKEVTFIVRESRSYNPAADASIVFLSNDGKPHLNLITCEGAWNITTKSYSARLVVFTDKE